MIPRLILLGLLALVLSAGVLAWWGGIGEDPGPDWDREWDPDGLLDSNAGRGRE